MVDIIVLTLSASMDHGALANMAYSEHLSDASAHHIASRALDAALEDEGEDISPEHYAAALTLLIGQGWAARERKQQADMTEDQDIWIGGARAEARREGA